MASPHLVCSSNVLLPFTSRSPFFPFFAWILDVQSPVACSPHPVARVLPGHFPCKLFRWRRLWSSKWPMKGWRQRLRELQQACPANNKKKKRTKEQERKRKQEYMARKRLKEKALNGPWRKQRRPGKRKKERPSREKSGGRSTWRGRKRSSCGARATSALNKRLGTCGCRMTPLRPPIAAGHAHWTFSELGQMLTHLKNTWIWGFIHWKERARVRTDLQIL